MSDSVTYEPEVDPGTLLIDDNLREVTELDLDLVASIRELGVLQPVVAVRTASGERRVEMGHGRTLAAIEAGRTVGVLVIGDEGSEAAARVRLRLRQWDENTFRKGLTTADKIKVVQEWLDLGLDESQIRRRFGRRMCKPDVAAAVAASKSPAATGAVRQEAALTLIQAAAIAEFEDEPGAAGQLVEAAQSGQFDHVAQKLRDTIAQRAAEARRRAELEAEGITVTDDEPESIYQYLRYLRTEDGEPVTEETHRDCPGRAAVLDWGETWTGRGSEYVLAVRHYCTDPAAHGHVAPQLARVQQGGQDEEETEEAAEARVAAEEAATEEARAERALVRRNNDAWRSAETVRREWLREFLTRKKLPQGGLAHILAALAHGDRDLARAMNDGHEFAAGVLGIARPDGAGWADYGVGAAFNAAPDPRAQVIVLGLVLAAREAVSGVHTWRAVHDGHPGGGDRRYFQPLAAWGYPLSEVEQLVAGDSET